MTDAAFYRQECGRIYRLIEELVATHRVQLAIVIPSPAVLSATYQALRMAADELDALTERYLAALEVP